MKKIFSILLCGAMFAGMVACDNKNEPDDDQDNNEPTINVEAVDLDLPSGTLWAPYNIGATAPEEYGDYFALGETKPKDEYTWANYKWCYYTDEGVDEYGRPLYSLHFTKYYTGEYVREDENITGKVDNKTQLEAEDDAATANWGEEWRMPTDEEIEELYYKCDFEWETRTAPDGSQIQGLKVTGPNGNSIFFPTIFDEHLESFYSGYWSANVFDDYGYAAYVMYSDYDGTGIIDIDGADRYIGNLVRPVKSKK